MPKKSWRPSQSANAGVAATSPREKHQKIGILANKLHVPDDFDASRSNESFATFEEWSSEPDKQGYRGL
jgi:hypothetical protein